MYSEQHPGGLHGRDSRGTGGTWRGVIYSTLNNYFWEINHVGAIDSKLECVIYFKGKFVQQEICLKLT